MMEARAKPFWSSQAKMVDSVSPVKGAVALGKNPFTGEMQAKMVK